MIFDIDSESTMFALRRTRRSGSRVLKHRRVRYDQEPCTFKFSIWIQPFEPQLWQVQNPCPSCVGLLFASACMSWFQVRVWHSLSMLNQDMLTYNAKCIGVMFINQNDNSLLWNHVYIFLLKLTPFVSYHCFHEFLLNELFSK